jgi:hypothetical protein
VVGSDRFSSESFANANDNNSVDSPAHHLADSRSRECRRDDQ